MDRKIIQIVKRIIVIFIVVSTLILGTVVAAASEFHEITNVAMGKTVEGSGTNSTYPISKVNDGTVASNNYWDGGVAPGWFLVDLGTGHIITEIIAYPLCYNNDGRAYQYEIYAGLYKNNYTLVGEKKNDNPSTVNGDTFTFDEPLNARYIYVKMISNTKNTSVHMSEIEVFGYADPDYVEPSEGDYDMSDVDNIAYKKSVMASSGVKTASNVTDGGNITYWQGDYYPSYVDIDLGSEHVLEEAILNFPVGDDVYYYYTVYGSNDGSSFERIYQKRNENLATDKGDTIDLSGHTFRFIRVNIEYVSNSGYAMLSEVRVHGKATGENCSNLRDGDIEDILSVTSYENSQYNTPIADSETIENVYGIVERTVGSEYRDWFEFEIAENTVSDNDYYEISNLDDGRILIRGNDGVSLASGLNYYYKYYCNVHISEQARQTKMPESIVPVDGIVRKETPYKIRYAMNYCTLEYTFAYFDYEDYQRENDWLALNGVNVVLDIAGQEAVWIKFLMNFGYSFDEAKNWLTGPSYYAWQFMGNMERYGGSVPDGWVEDRLELARKTQRWKSSLGMQTILQGYAGMVPTDFTDYQDVDVIVQGKWCGHQRPNMIRTDGELYDEYAALFYECQKWAFGDNSNYYAVDPFHEGGIRPDDLGDDIIASEVLSSLLKYDSDAVWVVQSWQANPTQELLNGMGSLREDHALVLDLTAMYRNRWAGTSYGSQYGATELNNIEFDGTPWVWCLLKNYGANPSMDWGIERLVREVKSSYSEASYMKGIGIISEATFDNPLVYDLIFELVWETEDLVLDDWLNSYIERRYGYYSQNAENAWALLRKTVYNNSGNTPYVMAKIPEKASIQTLPYDQSVLEEAFLLLLEDYYYLSESEAYLYDLTEIMRQIVNNYALIKHNELITAYNSGDIESFKTCKKEFLNAFVVCDLVQSTHKDQLVGEWVGKARDWALKYDDYSYDTFLVNAKALITTWGSYDAALNTLIDYSYRNYQGMMIDLYLPRWSNYLDKLQCKLEDSTTVAPKTVSEYFHDYWVWVINTPEYTREPNDSPDFISDVCARVISECFLSDDAKNIALGKDIEVSYSTTSYPGTNANDGNNGSYWDGGLYSDSPYAIVDLGGLYSINKINVINYPNASRYYHYEVYTSTDAIAWTLAYTKETDEISTSSGYPITFDSLSARYVKVVGKFNNQNKSFHVNEIQVYGSIQSEQISLSKPTSTNNVASANHPDSHAVDGNVSSYWDGGDYNQRPYLTVDLKDLYEISKINVVTYPDSARYYNYEVYISADGQSWVLAGEKTDDTASTTDGVDFDLSEVYARYVKVIGTYNSRNEAFHISELNVYGYKKDEEFTALHNELMSNIALLENAFIASDYSESSWLEFEGALANAVQAVESVKAVEFTLSNANKILLTAADGLEFKFKLRGAMLLINDDVDIIYVADVPGVYENVYIIFEFNGVSTRAIGTRNADKSIRFAFEDVLPQQFGDSVYATLYATYNGDSIASERVEFGVRDYCEYQLSNSDDKYLITLLSDMLVYGERAQIVSGYKTDSLVTDGISITPSTFRELDQTVNKAGLSGDAIDELKWRGAGLRLEGKIALYLTFAAESIDGMELLIEINGREITVDSSFFISQDGYYKVYIRGITACEFNDTISAKFIVNGIETGNVLSYSINSYIYVKQNATDVSVAELVRAIYNYGESVYAYSKINNEGDI